ncbi:NmrA-like negative transcriptional regulator family protein [Euphorbia peplus]|nr:NmrA-like negative transcriptional regulator family protein [Euphorbia peplus]
MAGGKKSKILIIGATGNLGYHLANSSLQYGHPTFILVRVSAFSDPLKLEKINSLCSSGATLIQGSLEDKKCLVDALKQVDVVICSIPSKLVLLQKLLISAVLQAGCIKKFIPSEFGADPYKVQISDMDHNFYMHKSEIRHLIETQGIPYTYISCNFLMNYLLPSLIQPGSNTPPRDKVTVFGDGNVKGVFVKQEDVAAFTICAVDDPRTLNKVVYLRPPGNVYSMNELVELWEGNIGKKLQRIYVPEDQLLMKIKETPYPENMNLVFIYSVFVKGDHTYFDIESCGGLDGTQLYPQIKYTTISEYLETLI